VPLVELDIAMPWARPVPKLLWFDRRLRVWFSAQPRPAPLVIVIAGTGAGGNAASMSLLRGALYGAGYHVLTMPSPTAPGFIVSASSTGIAGDLRQDGEDLYAAMQQVIARLPRHAAITDIDVLGYSLGGANAAVVKSIDTSAGRLHIHRAVMINPPVSLYASMTRLDRLFAVSIGPGDAGIERLYRKLYAKLANLYRASKGLPLDESYMRGAAALGLRSDADMAAVVALSLRLTLINMFYLGDLYAGTGVLVDPAHPPQPGDSQAATLERLRAMTFSDYFSGVFTPYYLARQRDSVADSLITGNNLEIIGTQLRENSDYYAQTNSDDLILDEAELQWLKDALGQRLAVYDHGGHLGNLGERAQIADMLDMLAGRWGSSK
jgi:predicted alpha/beta-fold hydrolase